jgi:hypothetical protein
MIEERRPDDPIRLWVRDGPMIASTEFVDRTMRPIPRMRQRSSWRVRLARIGGPVSGLAAAAMAIVLVVAGLSAWSGGFDAGATPVPSPDASRPTFQLELQGSQVGSYRDDPTAATATCRQAGDGSWRLLYGGGDPYVSIDLLVVPDPAGGSADAAAEIYAGPAYFRFDPGLVRGGDPAGRSEASVDIQPGIDATTFVVDATTPDRTTGVDLAPIDVSLTVVCPT